MATALKAERMELGRAAAPQFRNVTKEDVVAAVDGKDFDRVRAIAAGAEMMVAVRAVRELASRGDYRRIMEVMKERPDLILDVFMRATRD